MKKKRKALVFVLSLGTLFFGLSLICLLHPAGEFSESERRPLAQLPEFTVKDFVSGSFIEGFEAYAPDQFPLRETFRSLKALLQYRILGMRDNNGVYQAEGYLSKLEYPLKESAILRAAKKFNALYESYMKDSEVSVYYAVIPDKNYFLAAANAYPSMDYEALLQVLREELDPAFQEILLFDTLELSDYYKTDTHWRQENLSDVLMRLAGEMGFSERIPWGGYTEKEYEGFYGVYAGQWALKSEAESIFYLTNAHTEAASVYDLETDSYRPVYDLEKTEGDKADPYDLFLSGPAAYQVIENPLAETEKELVVFRDSFGSSLVPLLIPAYSRITLVDIRYIASQYLEELLDFEKQDVLFLYSSLLLNNSMSFK